MKGLMALYFIVLVSTICGCTPDIHSKDEFFKYVKNKDHGLMQEFEKSGILASATYVPAQIIYNQQQDTQQNKKEQIGSSSRICFIVSLSRNGKELMVQLDRNVYSNVLQTLSFRMMPLVSLKLDDKNAITPSDCLFQQTYGLSTSNELLLVFDSPDIKTAETYKLTIDEFGVGLGEMKYNFSRSDIDRLNKALKI